VQGRRAIRGDYFIDRLGGWTEVLLALTSAGIACSRLRKGLLVADLALAGLYVIEILGALAITRSKLPLMRLALWIFSLRVVAGFVYLSAVHGDKLARSTIGFPIVVAVYCGIRVRALRAHP